MNEQQIEDLRALASQRRDEQDQSPIVRDIVEAVALAFGISPAEIMGRDRTKALSEARQVSCFISRRCTRMSYPELGKALGLDHTTVLASVRKVELRRARDRWTASACDVLLRQFGAVEETTKQ